jgi:hypothetical protein
MKSKKEKIEKAVANAINALKNCGDEGFLLVTKNQTIVCAAGIDLATMMMFLITHYPMQYGLCCKIMANCAISKEVE